MKSIESTSNSSPRGSKDLLGSKLSILLALLNESPGAVMNKASHVTAAELTVRKNLYDGSIGIHQPDWIQGRALFRPLFKDEKAIGQLQTYLQTMISAWIDTGWSESEEAPLTRSLGHPRFHLWQEHREGGESAEWLFELMQSASWQAAYKINIGNASRQGAGAPVFEISNTGYSQTFSLPLREALATMTQLLLSEDRFHIARCRRTGCDRFFWRRRTSKCKAGLFCPVGCQNKVSAAKSTQQKRNIAAREKLERAVEIIRRLGQFRAGYPTTLTMKQKIDIVSALNKAKSRKHPNATTQWLSRSWAILSDILTKQDD